MSRTNGALSDEAQTPQSLVPTYQEQSKSMMEQIAQAKEQSRYAIAQRFSRDIEVVRQNMLRECSRPEAVMPDQSKNGSSVMWYRLPKVNGVEGFSIRFAEMARQAWGHTFIDVVPMGEDETQRIFQVTSTDYQTNNGSSEIVIMSKAVERSSFKPGDTVLSQRTNSYGKAVYSIIGTDDDLLAKKNALTSKARRNLILELIPGWLKEECKDKMFETARKKDAEDPDAAKRKLYDAFVVIGVTVEMLNEYVGHSGQLQPKELEDLRGFYGAMREGHTTWAEIVAAKDDQKDSPISKQIDELLRASGRTAAVARKLRAEYVNRAQELLDFLKGEAAKKADTGGEKQQEAQQQQPAKEERGHNGLTGEETMQQLKQPNVTNFPNPGTPVDPTQTLPLPGQAAPAGGWPKTESKPAPPPIDEGDWGSM